MHHHAQRAYKRSSCVQFWCKFRLSSFANLVNAIDCVYLVVSTEANSEANQADLNVLQREVKDHLGGGGPP